MSAVVSTKPESTEYAPDYEQYLKLVPDGNILEILETQIEVTYKLLGSIDENMTGYRYGDGKWSIKELIGHLCDNERVLAYRLLCFSRNDKTALPGYEQDDYISNADYDSRTLVDIGNEYKSVRLANLYLFRSFKDNVWMRRGTASGFEFTVRAMAHLIAGHELHHRNILKERYLKMV